MEEAGSCVKANAQGTQADHQLQTIIDIVHCPTETRGDIVVQRRILGEQTFVQSHVDLDFRLQERECL